MEFTPGAAPNWGVGGSPDPGLALSFRKFASTPILRVCGGLVCRGAAPAKERPQDLVTRAMAFVMQQTHNRYKTCTNGHKAIEALSQNNKQKNVPLGLCILHASVMENIAHYCVPRL